MITYETKKGYILFGKKNGKIRIKLRTKKL